MRRHSLYETCCRYAWVMSHVSWLIYIHTWLFHTWDMTLSYLKRHSLFETCCTYKWVMSHQNVTWLIHLCNISHSYVCHDSFICVTWLIHMCDTTHSDLRHDAFICLSWFIHMCDMNHSYVWHESFICPYSESPSLFRVICVLSNCMSTPSYKTEQDLGPMS